MKVLGISCYFHDAAACLYVDGRLVAAAEEERFSRVKHDARFPVNAIASCLAQAGLTAADVDHVVFHEKPLRKFERILASCLEGFPRSFPLFRTALHTWLGEKLWVPTTIRSRTGYRGEVLYLEHHLSHAASAFLPSPFTDAAVVTVDGVGEWTTTAIGHGSGSHVELSRELRFPHSLGLLYSVLTGYLGFEVNEGEYKVMALAAHGRPRFDGVMRDIVRLAADGSYSLDMRHFDYHRTLTPWRALLERRLGPPRSSDAPMEDRHADIASSLQSLTEDAMVGIALEAHREVGGDALALAGGVGLNILANREIRRRTPFRRLFIPPAPGDAGAAVGAAAYVSHAVLGLPRGEAWSSAFLGPEYDAGTIARFLSGRGIAFSALGSEANLLDRVAQLIATGNVVGWFRGRMEFGPRALGARSILANACDPAMRETVNEKIKFREPFRPFGAAVAREAVGTYFADDIDSPFMLTVSDVRAEHAERLRSVTHVDGTARLQTVTRASDPVLHALLERVGSFTGAPMVLNTSFNVRGQPIVLSPEQAFECFASTAMDALVLWPYLIEAAAKRAIPAPATPPAPTSAWLT